MRAGARPKWRRGRDSNPRYGVTAHTLSRRAPSTARTPLLFTGTHCILKQPLRAVGEGGIVEARCSRPSILADSHAAHVRVSCDAAGRTLGTGLVDQGAHTPSNPAPSTARTPLRYGAHCILNEPLVGGRNTPDRCSANSQCIEHAQASPPRTHRRYSDRQRYPARSDFNDRAKSTSQKSRAKPYPSRTTNLRHSRVGHHAPRYLA